MGKERLKKDIVELVEKKGEVSIKEIARIYYDGLYVPKRETRAIIKELIAEKILVRVDDVDAFGKKVDDVVINDDMT